MTHRFLQHSGRLYVTPIVLGELFTWAYRRQDPRPTLNAIATELLPQLNVLIFDQDCAELFGKTRAVMLNQGRSIDGIDLEIAVTALMHDLTLITNNTSDFTNVPNLCLDDWLMP